MFDSLTSSWITKRRLGRYRRLIKTVHKIQAGFLSWSDEELRAERLSLSLQARSGVQREKFLPRSFALIRESARRTVSMEHYDAQLLGGCALAEGYIAEMATGEGKTFTATLPLFLYSLFGRGAHLVTANDYLAERDAEWVRPIFELLGVQVGSILQQSSDAERALAYQADITYGTLREFTFYFLREQLSRSQIDHSRSSNDDRARNRISPERRFPSDPPFFLLVDEADSLLIDEARTPLIISLPSEHDPTFGEGCFFWANHIASKLALSSDYELDPKARSVRLNQAGKQSVREKLSLTQLRNLTLQEAEEAVCRALVAQKYFCRDEHYVIDDDEVQLIDSFTGRIAVGRKLRQGVHQAIEVREGLPLTKTQEPAARMTVNDYTSRYHHLAGMTGTASEVSTAMKKYYDCRVLPIPTIRPCRRDILSVQIFETTQEKYCAIAAEILVLIEEGRSVLIGTRTIQHSLSLSEHLNNSGIEHLLLNGVQDVNEADIISQTGQPSRVTVATNMAGRGTDIHLSDQVREAGGLHVIGTEFHESARIDRQLAGRAARQGDPGSFRQMASFEDSILIDAWGEEVATKLTQDARKGFRVSYAASLFRQAQQDLERRQRHQLLLMLESERRRSVQNIEMGRDPWLDSVY
jgi:preprotein translocase subunit SecA